MLRRVALTPLQAIFRCMGHCWSEGEGASDSDIDLDDDPAACKVTLAAECKAEAVLGHDGTKCLMGPAVNHFSAWDLMYWCSLPVCSLLECCSVSLGDV